MLIDMGLLTEQNDPEEHSATAKGLYSGHACTGVRLLNFWPRIHIGEGIIIQGD